VLSALGNVWKIPELRQKITFTLVMFAIFRMGTHIPVPGVDPTAIEQLFANGNLFGLLDLFSGGAFSKFSIFAMSITPYINAAIIIQLLNVVIPTLEQWSKEGEEGHKKTTQVTRYLTVVLAFFQAIGMSIGLKAAILNPNPVNILIIAITLTAGTVFLMWLGEQITAQGVGNGISLIIFAGIVAACRRTSERFITTYRLVPSATSACSCLASSHLRWLSSLSTLRTASAAFQFPMRNGWSVRKPMVDIPATSR
jgi:preprotein translocase subunit SecY